MAQGATDGARWEYNSLPNLGTKKSDESIPRRATEVTGLLTPNKDDQSPTVGSSRRGYVLVDVVGFLYFFNIILAGPHTQFYVYYKMSEQYGIDSNTELTSCGNSSIGELKVQSQTTTVIMYLSFSKSLCCVLPTLILGSLSDRYGRKMVGMVAITGTVVKQCITTVVVMLDANVNYLLIGTIVEGTCGYNGGMLVALCSTVADITVPGKDRALRFISLQASLFLASAISQGVAGVWIEQTGFLIPLYTMMGLSLLNMVIVAFLLPETRRRTLTPLTLSESLNALKKSVLFYIRDTPDRRRWKLQVTLFAFFITYAVITVSDDITALYLLKSPFCWSIIHITLYNSLGLLVDWFCILTVTRCLGHVLTDVNVAVIGSVSTMLNLLLLGLARNDAMIYLAAATGVFAESLPPMLRSVMSQLVNNEEQGALFSSISVAEMISWAFLGLASIAGYRASLSILPGLVFLCYSGLMAYVAVSLGVVSCVSKTKKNRTQNRIHRNWLSVSADMYVKRSMPSSSVHIRLH